MNVPSVPPPPKCPAKLSPVSVVNRTEFINKASPSPYKYKIGIDEVRAKLKCLPAWRSEQLSEQLSSWVSVYHPVHAILQDGPQCGIVALCMASDLLHRQHLTVEIAFETAKSRGFTTYGEMFSVTNMCRLATDLLDCEAIGLTSGLSDSETVLGHLDKGWPILVPYDKDESNGPCCKQGRKAHWAVITGYLVRDVSQSLVSTLNQDDEIPNLYHKPNGMTRFSSTFGCRLHETLSSVYVYSKQGKSKHLGIWEYQALLLSNNNLLEWHAGNNDVDEGNMVIPDGGIGQGLCKQIILLKSKTQN